jgi:hypothetical protein
LKEKLEELTPEVIASITQETLHLGSFLCSQTLENWYKKVVSDRGFYRWLKAISKILCALLAKNSLGRGAQEAKHHHIQSSEFIHGVAPLVPLIANDMSFRANNPSSKLIKQRCDGAVFFSRYLLQLFNRGV